MSWTTLIAEYLVVGCLAALWIVLFSLAAAGSSPGAMLDWMNGLPDELGATFVVVVLAGFYSLGTAVDFLCYLATLPYLKWYNRLNWDIWLHYRSGGVIAACLLLWILTGVALYFVFKQFLRMMARAAR